MNETRYAQTAFISDPFSALHKRRLISGILCQKQLQQQQQQQQQRQHQHQHQFQNQVRLGCLLFMVND